VKLSEWYYRHDVMAFPSLRARLLLIMSALLVGMTAATLAYVSVMANRAVSDRIAADLARSRDALGAAETERFQRLALVAELVASFPDMRALFATDAATIRDFLSDFRQRHAREELLLALDASGEVVARSDTFAPLTLPDVRRAWIDPVLEGRPAQGFLTIDGRIYHGVLAAAESSGTIYGFVVAAAPIDDAWAGALRAVSGKEIVILAPNRVAASTLPAPRLPWRSIDDAKPFDATSGRPDDVDLGGERFQAVIAPSSADSPIRVISLQSHDLALAPYRNIQIGLLVVGLIAAAVGIGGSAMLARSITAPIGALRDATRQVSAGNFDIRLSVAREDEIGELASSFNRMTEGLRERADMQKFISQSTVQMIQSHQTMEQRSGERRLVTLLFADIRGFSAFAEKRAPEEAVVVLNRYLRLQADLVKRFSGDVDKFMGDAVFAHFTGPDMALDAIRCALEIQRAVDEASERDPSLPPLAVGIGIATGEVIVGSIGSVDRLDYTSVGRPVNLAARLCASADAHEILLSEETFTRVRDLVAAEAMAPLPVKGFSTPVRVYRMTLKAAV
jgi:class 3 adenylate cyclase